MHRLGKALLVGILVASPAAVGVPAARATRAPTPSGRWFVSTMFGDQTTAVDLETSGDSFVGKLVGRATYNPAFWTSAGWPCPGSAPVLPAGTVFLTGERTGDDTFRISLPYVGMQGQSEGGIQTAPFACPLHGMTTTYKLTPYATAIAANVIGRAFPYPNSPDLLVPDFRAPRTYAKHCDPGPGTDPAYANRSPYPDGDPSVLFCGWSAGASTWSIVPFVVADPRDTDGDGLPDAWETSGVTFNGVRLDLRAMGAKPDHKDLFLEIDRGEGASVPVAVTDWLTRHFENMPVSNPDGRRGISLHLDAGPATLMDGATGRRWGTRSDGEVLATPHALGAFSGPHFENYDWSDFTRLRDAHLSEARKHVFRYAIAGYYSGDGRGPSGNSELPGSDFLFGTHWRRGAGDDPFSFIELAGTIMHELGHTMGLRHGGMDNSPYKPNYLSIMGYLYQLTGLYGPGGRTIIDWSFEPDPASRALDERTSDEAHAFAGIAPTGWAASYACPGSDPPTVTPVFDPGGPADLNCNEHPDTGPTPRDIDLDGHITGLATQDDFRRLQFAAGSVGGAGRPAIGGGLRRTADDLPASAALAIIRSRLNDRRPPVFSTRQRGRKLVIAASDDTGVGAVTARFGKRTVEAPAATTPSRPRRATVALAIPRGSRTAKVTVVDAAHRTASRTVAVRA